MRGVSIGLMVAMLFSWAAQAQGPESLDPIGRHFKLFRFEKNENPQNILIGYTKLASDCRFERSEGHPVVDFYWLLDGSRYKDPHRLIKKSIRNRLAYVGTAKAVARETDAFAVRLLESKDMKSPVKTAVIRVSSTKGPRDCDVKVVASFEQPNGEDREMKLSTIRTETKKTWLPPFRKIVSITLEGESVHDGRLLTQVFN